MRVHLTESRREEGASYSICNTIVVKIAGICHRMYALNSSWHLRRACFWIVHRLVRRVCRRSYRRSRPSRYRQTRNKWNSRWKYQETQSKARAHGFLGDGFAPHLKRSMLHLFTIIIAIIIVLTIECPPRYTL